MTRRDEWNAALRVMYRAAGLTPPPSLDPTDGERRRAERDLPHGDRSVTRDGVVGYEK